MATPSEARGHHRDQADTDGNREQLNAVDDVSQGGGVLDAHLKQKQHPLDSVGVRFTSSTAACVVCLAQKGSALKEGIEVKSSRTGVIGQ